MVDQVEILQKIRCYSLVDITQTGTTGLYRNKNNVNFDTWNHDRNQQRNFESILQILSLRAQPMNITEVSLIENASAAQYKFGKNYNNLFNVWTFDFEIEHAGVFDKNDFPFLELIISVDNVPCIAGLRETIKLSPACFRSTGDFKNIYFEYITR